MLRFLEAQQLSPRGAASLLEIDRTLSTWPQVSGDVAAGAPAIAEAVRRIGLGEHLPSGRTRLDIGGALDRIAEPALPEEHATAGRVFRSGVAGRRGHRCRRCDPGAVRLQRAALAHRGRPRRHHHPACAGTHLDDGRRVPGQCGCARGGAVQCQGRRGRSTGARPGELHRRSTNGGAAAGDACSFATAPTRSSPDCMRQCLREKPTAAWEQPNRFPVTPSNCCTLPPNGRARGCIS